VDLTELIINNRTVTQIAVALNPLIGSDFAAESPFYFRF